MENELGSTSKDDRIQSQEISELSGAEDLDVDHILENIVKPLGLWQISLTLIFGMSTPALSNLGIYFTNAPYFRCKMDPLLEAQYSNASFESIKDMIGSADGCGMFDLQKRLVPCPHGYVYHFVQGSYPDPIIRTWDLVCDRAWMVPFINSSFMAGMAVGFFIGGTIGSYMGRRKSIILLNIMEVAMNICCTFAHEYWLFVTLRTLLGFSISALFGVESVLLIECTTAKYRSLYISLMSFCIGFVGKLLIVSFAYLCPTWPSLNLVSSSLCVVGLINILVTPESPRWLFTQSRYHEALKILRTGYRRNKLLFDSRSKEEHEEIELYFDKVICLAEISIITSTNTLRQQPATARKTKSAMRSRRFWCSRQIYICTFLSGMCNIIKLGLVFYARLTRESVYLTTVFNACMDIPSQLLSFFVYRICTSRKKPFIVITLVCAVVLIVPMIFGGFCNCSEIIRERFTKAIVNLGLILGQAANSMMLIYIMERFPANERSEATGLSTGLGRVIAVTSDFINELNNVYNGLPLLVYGICAFLASILLLTNEDSGGQDKEQVTLKKNVKTRQSIAESDVL
ncbi:hypothetical protein Ciccas_005812 [Cichlidogyrus casuarinus]|uniref:Uncharacterized protein n=1 Tax=Cichlidogyrus casuarinus TaxID=1844966 RepID=A0ABD2Q7K2_9PLAT